MIQARLKIKTKGLRLDSIYQVETINTQIVAGQERTAVHLKKFTDREKTEWITVIVPLDWVEIVQDNVAT